METDRRWSDTVRYIALIMIIIFLIVMVYIARGSLTLIFMAAIIAYILSPLVRFQVRVLRFKQSFAVFISYLLLIVLFIVLVSLVLPLIAEKTQGFLAADWPTVITSIDGWLGDLILELDVNQPKIMDFELDLTVPLVELRKAINSFDISRINVSSLVPDFSSMLQSVISVSANIVGTIFGILITVLTTVMASIHFCNDGWKLKQWIPSLFREPYRPEIEELLRRLFGVWNNYFAGQIKLMLFIGITTFIVCSVLGLKWALLLGIIAGFCEVVPNIGPIIACFPAVLSALIFGSEWIPLSNFLMAVVSVGAYILIQQLENILVVPRVMGSALDIHPVVITLGILILSSRLGLLGALLASPLIGLMKEVLGYLLCKIRKEDPFPEIYLQQETQTLAIPPE